MSPRGVGATQGPQGVPVAARTWGVRFSLYGEREAVVPPSTTPSKVTSVALVVLLATLLAGCLGGPEEEGPGHVAVYLRGDPDDPQALAVTVTSVQVVTPALLAEAEEIETSTENATRNTTGPVGGSTIHVVSEDAVPIGLSGPAAEGGARSVAQGQVASGQYTHLVVKMEGGQADSGPGHRVAVGIPRPYLVLSGPFEVDPGEITQFVLDLDIDASTTGPTEEGSQADIVFDPELDEVRMGVVDDTPENRRSLEAGELQRKEFMVHTAANVRIERGALMLSEPLLKQRADVGVDLRLDLDGDGVAEETLVSGAGPSGAIPTATVTTTTTATTRTTATKTGSPNPTTSPTPTASPTASPSPSPAPTSSPTGASAEG